MSTNIANQPTLAASIPRAVFSFGTHTYTAIQTAGPSQAVIGKATISVGGQAAQFNGGYASLATNGLVFKAGTATQSKSQLVTTSKSMPSVVTGRRVEVTLASTTIVIVAPSGAVQAGTKLVAGSTLEWVLGQQTLRPVYNGVVVASGPESQTYTYSLANITRGATVEQQKPNSLATSSSLRSASSSTLTRTMGTTSSFARSAKETTSSESLETTSLPAGSTTFKITSSASALIVTETATVTSMPSDASSLRGVKVAWMAMVFLLAGLSAI